MLIVLFLPSLDWDDENKIPGGDNDDEISGSRQDESGDSFDFHDTRYKVTFLSRDQAQQKLAGKDRHRHTRPKQEHHHLRPVDLGGGAGILFTLVVTAFVLCVVSFVFLHR